MKEFKTQVDQSHYKGSYEDLQRWISYYYQITTVKKLGVKKILEIGIGSKTFSNYLKSQGYEISTCDYDKTLKPDILADVREIPVKDASFDCAVAFEILEHLPFKEFDKGLGELARVSKKYVVLSIPYSSIYLEGTLKFPFANKILKKGFLRIFLHIPFFSRKFLSKEHFWELGRRGYSRKRIRSVLKKNFRIKKEFRPALDTYHYFFVLEKKD